MRISPILPMSFTHKLARNARTALANPAIGIAYSRWLVGGLRGNMTVATHFGAQLSEFENFSNYWGTIRKIPSAEQFNSVASFLKGDDAVCFDVGANIGSFTIVLGSRSPNCYIHAFEPAPNTARILQSNVDRNQLAKVRVHRLAVTDFDGSVRFSNEPTISQRNHIITKIADSPISCEVAATSLDSFSRKHNLGRIGFAKIDCEGAEPLVLRGARQLLRNKQVAAIWIEVCPRNLETFGFSTNSLLAEVSEIPYAFYRFQEDGVVGERLTDQQLDGIQSEDLLLLPQ
jgi:FkbM family methyltransferase